MRPRLRQATLVALAISLMCAAIVPIAHADSSDVLGDDNVCAGLEYDTPTPQQPPEGLEDLWASLCNTLDQTARTLVDGAQHCSDESGKLDLYVLIDSREGPNFSVWVYQGVVYGYVRVAWDAQIPRSEEGVTIELASGGYTYQSAHRNAIAGTCGVIAGYPVGPTYAVSVYFMGQDVQVTNSEGVTVSCSVTVALGLKFEVKPKSLPTFSLEASFTGTFTYERTYTVTAQGYLKTFHQSGYENLNLDGLWPGIPTGPVRT